MVDINWSPDAKELRKFGVAMLVGFSFIGAFLFWRGHPTAGTACLVFGLAAGGLGLTGTRVALPVYLAWMGIAFVAGNVVSRVLIALLFYLLITPMGLVMRLVGRDKLALKPTNDSSYWTDVSDDEIDSDYERQF